MRIKKSLNKPKLNLTELKAKIDKIDFDKAVDILNEFGTTELALFYFYWLGEVYLHKLVWESEFFDWFQEKMVNIVKAVCKDQIYQFEGIEKYAETLKYSLEFLSDFLDA